MADGSSTLYRALHIREECGPFWQVSAWPDTLGAVAARLADAVGADVPRPGGIVSTEAGQIARVAPLVWWVIGAQEDAIAALHDLPPEEGAVLDLTDNRTRFVVSGPRARDMMMRLAPLDFRERAFPVGHIAATAAHHMSVHIARREDAWDVYATSTFADALEHVLSDTAAQWA